MSCFCIGPQRGEPVCPCKMPSVKLRDGRWVEEIDHGQVKPFPPYPHAWDKNGDEIEPCLFDQFKNDPNWGGGALMLSCSCPKCTPRC